MRKAVLNRVLPRLKSFVVKPRSSRKLSVLAWLIFVLGRSRAKKAVHAWSH